VPLGLVIVVGICNPEHVRRREAAPGSFFLNDNCGCILYESRGINMELTDGAVITDAGNALPEPVRIEFSPGTGNPDPCRKLRGEGPVEPVRDDIGLPAPVFRYPVGKAGHIREPRLCPESPRCQRVPFCHLQILLRISI
jgi:hypothetical protein